MSGVLIFDGDCGFCTTCAQRIDKWFGGSLKVEPYQFSDLAALGLSSEQTAAAVQWIATPGAEARSGAAAIAALLVEGGHTRGGAVGRLAVFIGWAMQTPPLIGLSRVSYELVARNRHRLPGATPACQMRTD